MSASSSSHQIHETLHDSENMLGMISSIMDFDENENSPPLVIQIKTLSNSTYRVVLHSNITVAQLKTKIYSLLEIPQENQRLIYRGRLLRDPDLVSDYNLVDGHTIHLVTRRANDNSMAMESSSPTQAITSTTTNSLDSNGAVNERLRARLNRIRRIRPVAASSNINSSNIRISTQEAISRLMRHHHPRQRRREDNGGMEHLRQGVLTIGTLLSTMEGIASEEMTSSSRGALPTRRHYYVGQWLDAQDTVNQWLEATVLNTSETEILIHYNGWPSRWDEWISKDSNRIAPFRTRTIHVGSSQFASPSPVHVVPHAPATGDNNLRHIIPQLRDALYAILPHVDELAALCIEETGSSTSSSPLAQFISTSSMQQQRTAQTSRNEANRLTSTPSDEDDVYHDISSTFLELMDTPDDTSSSLVRYTEMCEEMDEMINQLLSEDEESSSPSLADDNQIINEENTFSHTDNIQPLSTASRYSNNDPMESAASLSLQEKYQQKCRQVAPLLDRLGRLLTDSARPLSETHCNINNATSNESSSTSSAESSPTSSFPNLSPFQSIIGENRRQPNVDIHIHAFIASPSSIISQENTTSTTTSSSIPITSLSSTTSREESNETTPLLNSATSTSSTTTSPIPFPELNQVDPNINDPSDPVSTSQERTNSGSLRSFGNLLSVIRRTINGFHNPTNEEASSTPNDDEVTSPTSSSNSWL